MRSLEDHLSPQELANLPVSPEGMAFGGPEQQKLSQHLQRCEICAELAQTHWYLNSSLPMNTAVGTDCPTESDWFELAAGLRTEQSQALLHHAAGCRNCAAALKEAMYLMETAPADAETEQLEELESSTPDWQHRMALQMMTAASVAEAPRGQLSGVARSGLSQRLRLSSAWITVPLAASLAAGVVLAGIAAWRIVHPSEARLLALAYNQQRTLALRIPGAEPAPMASSTRGLSNSLSDSADLLELRLRAQRHLDETPNSAYWHQVLGEVNLLEQDGSAARRNFEIAQTADEKLVNLKSDLAAAWFEIGTKGDDVEAFAQAAELYSQQLQEPNPNVSLLRYNRALCWEKLSLNENALVDLRAALAAEPTQAWRKAIQAEIDRISDQTTIRAADGYETALNEATIALPQWSNSSRAHEQIQKGAALGLQHGDHWLQEWLVAKHTLITRSADEHLSAALEDANRGDAVTSLTEAQKAVALYQHANHEPGLLRARLAESYGLQRLGHSGACLKELHLLLADQQLQKFAWLRARVVLESAECSESAGDFDTQQKALIQASLLSAEADLPQLQMRDIASSTELAYHKGLFSRVWRLSADGLRQCHLDACSPAVEYPFLYLSAEAAQSGHLSHVAAEIMKSAVPLAQLTRNNTTYAYSLESLGSLFGRVGEYSESALAFDRAQAVQAASPGPMAAIYRADWQTDEAEVLNLQARSEAAAELLQQTGPVLLKSDYIPGRLRYWHQLARTQRLLHQDDEALISSWRAVREAERSLPTLRNPRDKVRWQRANDILYSELVQTLLDKGEDTQALQVWERFRAAAYKTHETASLSSAQIRPKTVTQNPRILILARIDSEYIGWLAEATTLRSVRMRKLGPSAPIIRTATTFYRLCADKDSSFDDVRQVGAQLYSSLIAPFAPDLDSSTRLRIDADDDLAMLPFSALVTSNGDWLGNARQIALLPEWWTLDPSSAISEPTVSSPMHVLAVSGFHEKQWADSEMAGIIRLFPNAKVLEGETANKDTIVLSLPAADIFHFGGHSASDTDSNDLLTPSGDLPTETIDHVHLPHCRLVVLAACNTTASEPDRLEKLPDMRNAFLLAGARSVVATIWDVDDRSTQALMDVFYQRLVAGETPAFALQKAQQQLQLNKTWHHPYYWAPFETFTN